MTKCTFCNNKKTASLTVVDGNCVDMRYFCQEHLKNKPSKIENAFHILKDKDRDSWYLENGNTDVKDSFTSGIQSIISSLKKIKGGENSPPVEKIKDISNLDEKLKKAVEKEDFTEAVRLRDLIKNGVEIDTNVEGHSDLRKVQ